ncbi:division initiation protein, partial [Clostridium botulinum]
MDIIIRYKEKYLYFSFFILYRNIYYKQSSWLQREFLLPLKLINR